MDKQKQIEEMAKDLKEEKLYALINKTSYMRSAENLIDAGYRKIPKNAVVLTREEYEELKSLANDHCKYCHLMDLPDFQSEKIVRDTTRKETAEKFGERLVDFYRNNPYASFTISEWHKMINEIYKELTEGKL